MHRPVIVALGAQIIYHAFSKYIGLQFPIYVITIEVVNKLNTVLCYYPVMPVLLSAKQTHVKRPNESVSLSHRPIKLL